MWTNVPTEKSVLGKNSQYDIDKTIRYIADDIICDVPAGRLEGTCRFVSSKSRLREDAPRVRRNNRIDVRFGHQSLVRKNAGCALLP